MMLFQRMREALASRFGRSDGKRAPFSPRTLRWTLALLAVVALALFVLKDDGLLEHARLRRTLDSLEQRSTHLRTQISWYHARNKRLQENDSFTLEEEARRIGMSRPGEEVYQVVLPEDTVTRRED